MGATAVHRPPTSAEITQLLHAWSQGEHRAVEHLAPRVARELRWIAARKLAAERPGHTLQPTALVNELYLHLLRRRRVSWRDRRQFFGFAAQTMRRILVDHARARQSAKRGNDVPRLELDAELGMPQPDADLLALDEALKRLSALDAELGQLVELRFFAGLKIDETAAALGIGTATVSRRWTVARAWLLRQLRPGPRP